MLRSFKKRYFVTVLVCLGLFSGLYISGTIQFVDDVVLDLTGLSSAIYIDGDNLPRADSFNVSGANFDISGIWDSNVFTIEDASDNIMLQLTPSGGTADLSFSSANISDTYISQWITTSVVDVDYTIGVSLANQDYIIKLDGLPIAGSPFNSGASSEINFSYTGGGIFTVESPPCEDHELWGYAWSENIGWISFSCKNADSDNNGYIDVAYGGDNSTDLVQDYGVDINEVSDVLEGYAWSDNIGWISFNTADLAGCPSGTCEAGIDVSGASGALSGWARAIAPIGRPLSETGGWEGWIKLDGAGYQVTLNSTPSPSEFEGYAWSDDIVGWISFNSNNCDSDEDGFSDGIGSCPIAGTPVANYAVMTSLSLNSGPTANGLNVTNGNYCFSTSPPMFLNWTFSDPDVGDTQVSYQIEVDDNSDFSSPEIVDAGGSSETYAPGVGTLSFSDTYWWRVDVSDGINSSGWIDGPSFTTDPRWPEPSFTWLQDESSFDVTFDGSANYCAGCSYSWDFGDSAGTSSLEDPNYTYLTEDNFDVVLTATSASRSCNYSEIINVGEALPLPTWEETAPF